MGSHRRPLPPLPRIAGPRPAAPRIVIVVHRTDELRAAIRDRRIAGDSVGFVPTMGMLHDG
ncbi:MAG: pantoate--beta-alanine ligase, partial [Candidatus Limnocylindria bacterium]